MTEFYLEDLISTQQSLNKAHQYARHEVIRLGTTAMCGREKRAEINSDLSLAYEKIIHWNLGTTIARLKHFRSTLAGEKDMPCTVIESESRAIIISLDTEIREQRFVYIPSSKTVYFGNERLFGGAVYDAFIEARPEIKEAGDCLAVELYTAAVFHFMRIVEFGIRALALKMKAKTLIKKLKKTGIPIELGTWAELDDTLHAKLQEIKSKKRTSKREEKLEFYSEILKSFAPLFHTRNRTMHSRASFSETEALATFQYVGRFMGRLAKSLLE